MKILWFIYPFCSIFILVGAGLAFWTMRGMMKARAISNWPTVNAEMLECDFVEHSDSDSDSYEVKVRYQYMVNGKKYENDKIHPAYSASSFEGHRPLYDRLNKCTLVKARYNELDPSESYLLKGTFSAHLAAFFGGMIFFFAGVFFLLTFHFAIAGNSDYAAAVEIVK